MPGTIKTDDNNRPLTGGADSAGNSLTAEMIASATANQGILKTAPQGGPNGTSLGIYGTYTAPLAGGDIATTGNITAGNYEVTVLAWYGASADVADNMELKVGATSIGRLFVDPVANGRPIAMRFPRVNVPDATSPIAVKAVAAGAVGSAYKAQITFTPVL